MGWVCCSVFSDASSPCAKGKRQSQGQWPIAIFIHRHSVELCGIPLPQAAFIWSQGCVLQHPKDQHPSG